METIAFKNLAGIVLIPARANGIEGWFAFDTGAMQTALNSHYFSDLEGENKQVALFNESMSVNGALETKLCELAFGNITVTDLPVICTDLAYVENSLRAVEPDIRFLGSIGMEAFGNVPILLDYQRSAITVSPDVSTEGAERIPLSMEALPIITLELAGEPHRFVLDTGANTCLLSSELSDKIAASPSPDSPGVCLIPKIKAGAHEYQNIAAVFTDIAYIRDRVDVDGVIGYQILSAQRSLLDFPNAALWLF